MLQRGNKLGDALVQAGLISEEQLKKALEVQRGTTKRIGEILVELNLVNELDIISALSKQLGIPYVTRASGLLSPPKGEDLEQMVPEEFARQHLILPLSKNLNSLTIACVDPLDLIAMDSLSRLTGCQVNPIVAPRADLENAIDRFYGDDSMLKEAIGQSY